MNNTGIWTQEQADTCHAFSYRLAEKIGTLFNKYKPVMDFGCGKGTYCKYLEDIGYNGVIGIEGIELNNSECNNRVIRDLSQPFSLNKFGNVMSIEVGEHIPKEFEETFLYNLVNHVDRGCFLVLSWAHEGQQGEGHVNCRPDWWVKEQIVKRGLVLSPLTDTIRKVPEGHVAYLRENLFVFKKM